jgi:hypothetical protein
MEVSVNLRNPAQFFAACGIAALLGSDSRFEIEAMNGQPRPRAKFVAEGDIAKLVADLRVAKFSVVAEADGVKFAGDEYNRPVAVELAGRTTLLDWWLNEFWSDKSDLKTWAGTSTPLRTLTSLKEMIPGNDVADLLNARVEAGKSNRPSFGFDPRTASGEYGVAAHHAQVGIYPLTELLCAIGLQFVRPVRQEQEFSYHAWQDALPPELTWLVGAEGLDGVKSKRLVMRKEKRSKGIFAFGAAEFAQ